MRYGVGRSAASFTCFNDGVRSSEGHWAERWCYSLIMSVLTEEGSHLQGLDNAFSIWGRLTVPTPVISPLRDRPFRSLTSLIGAVSLWKPHFIDWHATRRALFFRALDLFLFSVFLLSLFLSKNGEQAGVCTPFEFGVADLLQVFHIVLIHVTPNSWKIVQAVVWFCEWKKCYNCAGGGARGHSTVGSGLPSGEQPSNSAYPNASTTLVRGSGDLASSSSGAEPSASGAPRPRLLTEELARKEADLRMVMILSLEMAYGAGLAVSPPEALTEPDHSRMVDPASASSSDGIPITAEKRRLAGMPVEIECALRLRVSKANGASLSGTASTLPRVLLRLTPFLGGVGVTLFTPIISPLRVVPLRILCWIECNSYLRWRLFVAPRGGGGHTLPVTVYILEGVPWVFNHSRATSQSNPSLHTSASFSPQVRMAEKRFVSSEDLATVKDCYSILSNIILSASEPHETPWAHLSAQAGVRVPLQWNNELPEVQIVATEELERGQRAALGPSSGSVRFRRPLILGENRRGIRTVKHRVIRGSPTPVLHCPGHRAWSEERSKKRKHLVKVDLAGQGLTALNKEAQERLARREEDLQAGLTLSREEARRLGLFVTLLEASMDPVSLGPAPLPVPVMNIRADTTSPTPVLELETSEVPGREIVEADTVEPRGPCWSVTWTWVRLESLCVVGSWDPLLEQTTLSSTL
ncbi:hypothetical protein ACLOJK_018753 [Asimina triloba]